MKCHDCTAEATEIREERAFSAVDARGELVSRTPLCKVHADYRRHQDDLRQAQAFTALRQIRGL